MRSEASPALKDSGAEPASSPVIGASISKSICVDLRSIPEGYMYKIDGTEELGSLKYLSKVKNIFHIDTSMIKVGAPTPAMPP
uniref:Uncharacterized protein n=1 Tax=Leersia perrieri TaxID=77586 RepID=A0A0D9WQ12_9ORYZ